MKRNIKFENQVVREAVSYINENWDKGHKFKFYQDFTKCDYAGSINLNIDDKITDYQSIIAEDFDSKGRYYTARAREARNSIYSKICEQITF